MVDIHDFLYVCIGDGGCPERSSSIRTRATVVEVTGWRFTFPSKDPPNLSIRWERTGNAAAPHVHRQCGHVRSWRKSLGGVSLSPRGIRRIFRFAGKRTGNVSPPFRQRQRTAILLLSVSNSTRRYRHLHCLYYFKRRHRGTRTTF